VELKIESKDEAKSIAVALHAWLRQGLEASGGLPPRIGEDSYYTEQRNTMNTLADLIKSA